MATMQTSPALARSEGVSWHTLPGLETTRALHVERSTGLTSEEAAARLAELGPNRVADASAGPPWSAFARQYRDPVQVVLLAAAIAGIALDRVATGLVLIALTAFNAVLAMAQEGRAPAAYAALQGMLVVRARVRRDGEPREIPAAELVPGDVVRLEAGDVVPADGRLLESATLEVDESVLTGECVPVAKVVDAVEDVDAPLCDRTDMVYMSTRVARGTAEAVVIATGAATEVGRVSAMLRAGEPASGLATRPLALTSRTLAALGAAVLCAALLNLARTDAADTVLTAAVAFAVAAMPVALPVVVTTILAYGAQMVAAMGATVRRPRAVETLGSVSAINSETAGALTLSEMTAVEMAVPGRRYVVSGAGYAVAGAVRHVAGEGGSPLEPFVLPLALASDAVVDGRGLVGDPIEGALVVLAGKAGIDVVASRRAYPRIAAVPFDASYRLMASFHRMTDESGAEVVRCFVMGAPDRLLGRATMVVDPDARPRRLDDDARRCYLGECARLAGQGLRVVATARRDFDVARFDAGDELLPLVDDLTLMALVGIADAPRAAAMRSIATATDAGIEVRMVTGDDVVSAAATARRLGVRGRAITGDELAAMTEDEATLAIEGIGVMARAAPEHRVRLVEALRRAGRVVAMTGDGVEDAPGLLASDVGIAMGRGSEVSTEAAAVVLDAPDFPAVVRAVESGRALHDGLLRAVRLQIAALAALVATFLGAAALHVAGGLPFTPLQTLYVDFTTLALQAIGLGCAAAAEAALPGRPRPVGEQPVARRTYPWIAVVAFVQAGVTLAVMAGAEHDQGVATVRTMGLVTLALTWLLYSLTLRCECRSVFSLDTFADRGFLIATGASFAAIVLGAQTGLANSVLGTTDLGFRQWLLCAGAALAIVVASEIRKALLRREPPSAERSG